MQCHLGDPRNSKLFSKFSIFPQYLSASRNNRLVQENVQLLIESLLKQKKSKNLFIMKFPTIDL